MHYLQHPFLWALLSLLGMQAAALIVQANPLGRNLLFTTLVLAAVTVGRIVLVLPFCPQPRFALAPYDTAIGVTLLLVAGAIALPASTIRWWRAAESGMSLRTRGVYGIVRHPLYLAELLWPIGWSVLWGSWIGLALTPLWWASFHLHAHMEEMRLESELGEEYRAYRRRVRGMILPGLPC